MINGVDGGKRGEMGVEDLSGRHSTICGGRIHEIRCVEHMAQAECMTELVSEKKLGRSRKLRSDENQPGGAREPAETPDLRIGRVINVDRVRIGRDGVAAA